MLCGDQPPGSDNITGWVLAGGQGLRMGGADKGLQLFRGRPLVQHAIERLQPQVSQLCINANRHTADYEATGLPVVLTGGAEEATLTAAVRRAMRHPAVDAAAVEQLRQLQAALKTAEVRAEALATGLEVLLFGGISLTVDGESVDPRTTVAYKGMMLSDMPNSVMTFGYTNASWTLKADLTAAWVCRLLRHMDRHGQAIAVVQPEAGVQPVPFLSFTSGYVQRALDHLPRQGARAPHCAALMWAAAHHAAAPPRPCAAKPNALASARRANRMVVKLPCCIL